MEDHIELNISTVGKRVVSTNAEREEVPLLKINTQQNLKQKALALFRGPQRLWSITLIALVTATFTMIGGYTLGYPSPSLLDLRNMTHGRSIKSGSIMENVYGAIAPLGSLFGGLLAGFSADKLGRKPTVILNAVPYLVGWTMIGVSWYVTNVPAFNVLIMSGRFISGCGFGWAVLAGPVYIGEISPPALRGFYSSFPQVLMFLGLLVVYCVGAIPGLMFYHTAFIASGMTVLALLFVVWIPETPRYLVTKRKTEEALKTLKFIHGPKIDPREELVEIEGAIAKQQKLSYKEFFEECSKKNVYLPFILMFFVMLFSGLNVIIFYSAPILQDAGFGKDSRFIALLTVGLTSLLATIANTLIVDLFGRKLLLMTSATIMTLSSFGIGLVLRFPSLHPIAILSVIGFQVGFCLGFSTISWILIPEMIPLRVRGYLGGILVSVNRASATVISGFYFVYADSIGKDVAWWTFAVVYVISLAFVAFFLPETKGKKLETMEKEWLNSNYKLCS